MSSIHLVNPTNFPYRGWIDVVIPKAHLPENSEWGLLLDSEEPWHLGRDIGRHGRMLHTYVQLAPGEERVAFLKPIEGVKWPYPTELSSWLADEIYKAAPGILVGAIHPTTGAREDLKLESLQIDFVSKNPVETIVRLRSRLAFPDGTQTPLFFRCYVYLKAMQDHADFDWQLIHSDATSSYLGYNVFDIRLLSGEMHSVDFGTRLSVGPSTYNKAAGMWETVLRAGKTVLGDGVRFSITGAVYGMPKDGVTDPDGADKIRLESMMARREMQPLGLSRRWDGNWLALKKVPALPFTIGDGNRWAQNEFKKFVDYLKVPGDYFDVRPGGLTKTPGQTGDQEDFGCTKGTMAVTTNSALGIYSLLFNVSDHLRPTAFYERNMELVTRAQHPNWITWSQRSHVSGSDRLSKDPAGIVPSYGWQGADDQHFSFLNTQASYALTGRLWLRDLLRERVEPALARYADGSGRAFGRVFQMLSNDALLLDDERPIARMLRDMDEKGLNQFIATAPGKYKAWQRVSDPRVLVDASNRPVLAMVIWQHGLMALGLRALENVLPSPDAQVRSALDAACRVVVDAGFLRRTTDGRWTVADAVAYNNGDGIPASDYRDGVNPGMVYTSGWFWEWNIGAVQIMDTLLSESETDGEADLIDKCRAILFQSGRPADRRSAEWRAVR